MNRTIKDATGTRFHYDDHDQLRAHLADFMAAYNFGRRLKTLNGLTPVVSRMWWKLPSSGLRACNDGSSQAARSRDIGSRGWDRVSQPSTFRIWI